VDPESDGKQKQKRAARGTERGGRRRGGDREGRKRHVRAGEFRLIATGAI